MGLRVPASIYPVYLFSITAASLGDGSHLQPPDFLKLSFAIPIFQQKWWIFSQEEWTGRREIMQVYLDNSATTKQQYESDADDDAARYGGDNFGNPSSLHSLGLKAEKEVGKQEECSGSFGSCWKKKFSLHFLCCLLSPIIPSWWGSTGENVRKAVITTAVEHPAILEPARRIWSYGIWSYLSEYLTISVIWIWML